MLRLSRRLVGTTTALLTAGALLTACGGSSLDSGGSSDTASGDSGSGASEAVTIGLLVPKSGVYSPLGADMENGFRLYLDQKKGRLGGHQANVTVVDEGEGPDKGVPAAQKLVQQDKVSAVVGIVNSATALGVRDLFEESKVPLIIANAGAEAITGAQKSDYVWRTSFSNPEVSAAIGPYVAEQVKGGSVYLMAPDYAAGKEFLAGFEKTFTEAGGKVAGQQLTPFGKTTNWQPYLAKVKQSGAKGVFVFYAGAEAVAFTKQYKELGLAGTVPLYSSGFLTEGGVLAAQGEAALGLESSLHYSNQIDTPRNKEFVQAYTTAYKKPPTVYSVQAYDAAQALDEAMKKGITGDKVVEGLKGISSIDSPRGEWKFSDGHGPVQSYYLRKVVQGEGGLVNSVVRELTKP